MSLTHSNFKEFRFNTKGEYHNQDPSNMIRRKKRINRTYNKINLCPSCGIARSNNNKCECNS